MGSHFAIYDIEGMKGEILTVHDAAERGDSRAIMRFSKEKKFDADAKDRFGRTALIWAADCCHLACAEALVRLGASIDLADVHTGRTALHWAARSGCLPIVKLLVTYSADFNKEDSFGLTPLYLSKLRRDPGGEDVFKYLLAEGANYNEMKAANVHTANDAAEAAMAAAKAVGS